MVLKIKLIQTMVRIPCVPGRRGGRCKPNTALATRCVAFGLCAVFNPGPAPGRSREAKSGLCPCAAVLIASQKNRDRNEWSLVIYPLSLDGFGFLFQILPDSFLLSSRYCITIFSVVNFYFDHIQDDCCLLLLAKIMFKVAAINIALES